MITIICSVILGAVLTLVVQIFLIRRWFFALPTLEPPSCNQYDEFKLPQELNIDGSTDDERKKPEKLLGLNLIFQFLFQEMKDTKQFRKWMMDRLKQEFTEILKTTTGKLLSHIMVRDMNVGGMFPVIQQAFVKSVSTNEQGLLEDLVIEAEIAYSGGFHLSVDVDFVFGKSAYLSVIVTKLEGTVHIHLTRLPFTHWSMSFIEEPALEFDVVSQFDGRPIPRFTSLITNQIRKNVRKKHTLPNYKIRYKPFFIKPEESTPPRDVFMAGHKLSEGQLGVTVMEVTRLMDVDPQSLIYCTVTLASQCWNEQTLLGQAIHTGNLKQQCSSPDRSAKTTNAEDSADYVHITITPGDVIDINLIKDKVSTSSEESSPSLSRRRKSATSPSVRYRNIGKKLELARDVSIQPPGSVEDVKPEVTNGKCESEAAEEDELVAAEDSREPPSSPEVKKTELVAAARDIVFGEKFSFCVEEPHSFLNICVMCRQAARQDKQRKLVVPEKHVVLAHVSISLMDVALQCLTTIHGDWQHTYKLKVPTSLSSKAAASRGKPSELASHRGYDGSLCHGDIRLAFRHSCQPLQGTPRSEFDTIRSEHEKVSADQMSPIKVDGDPYSGASNDKHEFVGTHFRNATYCNFCHKKIWLKTAFRCCKCGMVCHKKCTARCQSQSLCTPKHSHADGERKQSLHMENGEVSKDDLADDTQPDVDAHRRHLVPDVQMRRRYSAPDSPSKVEFEPFSPGASDNPRHPRTQSSTTLEEIAQRPLSPSLAVPLDDLSDDPSIEPLDSDDEEEDLVSFYEKQKRGHSADELVVTAAKQTGKELYADMSPHERKDKLDSQINKQQAEIERESEVKAELTRELKLSSSREERAVLKAKMAKSEERIQSVAILMLHYCAGLQHCLDQMDTHGGQADAADGQMESAGNPMVTVQGQLESVESQGNEESQENLEFLDDVESQSNVASQENVETQQNVQSQINVESNDNVESQENVASQPNIQFKNGDDQSQEDAILQQNVKSLENVRPLNETESEDSVKSKDNLDLPQDTG